jgi:hypothetical protein
MFAPGRARAFIPNWFVGSLVEVLVTRMNLNRTIAVVVVVTSLSLTSTLHAAVLNGGFESGSLQDWRLNVPRATSPGASPRLTGAAATASSWFAPNIPTPLQSALEGNYFSVLSSRPELLLNGARSFNITLTQRVHLMPGESVSGAASFFSQSSSSSDSAWVTILNGDGISLASPWRSPTTFGLNAATPTWRNWSWQAAVEGDYYLGLGLTTYCNESSPSYGFFDGIVVQAAQSVTPVPEPGALSIIALAVAGFAMTRKRTKTYRQSIRKTES